MILDITRRGSIIPFIANFTTLKIHVYKDLLQAWKLWREGMSFNLMDPILKGSCGRNEVMRCIHIALLCVQDDPDVRPSMATVVLMLSSYSVTLGIPQQPASLCESKTRSYVYC